MTRLNWPGPSDFVVSEDLQHEHMKVFMQLVNCCRYNLQPEARGVAAVAHGMQLEGM